MDILGKLMANYSGDAMQMLGNKVGLGGADSEKAVKSIAQLLTAKLAKNAETPEGAASLFGALAKHQNGGVLEQLNDMMNPAIDTRAVEKEVENDGLKILSHMFQKPEEEKSMVSNLASSLNIDSGTIMKLLPMVAPMVMGALGKAKAEEKVDEGGLSSMLGMAQKSIMNNKGLSAMAAGFIGNQVKNSLMKKAKSMLFKKFLG